MIRWMAVGMLLGAQLHAQGVAVGDRVRVTPEARGRRIEGHVLAADDSSLLVRERHRDAEVRLSYAAARRIERYDGRASAGVGALRGAGVGFLIGAGAGVLATGSAQANERDEVCDRDGNCYTPGSFTTGLTALLGFMFTISSTAVGAGIGAFVPPDRWRRVSVPGRLGLAPFDAGGRAGIGLVARF